MTENTQRRLATIVAADVAGYSRLMGADEEGTVAAFKAHRKAAVDPTIARHEGRIVNVAGDGLLIEFASVVSAVKCCVAIQRNMAARNQDVSAERRIEFRIGINLADVIVDGADIHGDGVNIAARLEAIADPGGICLSRAVFDQVRTLPEIGFASLGERALKNIEKPIETYRVTNVGAVLDRSPSETSAPGAMFELPERPSIAILPFRNLGRDTEHDFVADGIALGIQTLLVQLPGLFFFNACHDKSYREGDIGAKEALADVPVNFALEGVVQTSGARVRVTTHVTDLRTDNFVWVERYDRELDDVFALQDEITESVVASLMGEVEGFLPERISIKSLSARGTWEPYLKGVSHFYKFTPEDNQTARDMFEQITELHPEKSIGPGYVALTHWIDVARGWATDKRESLDAATLWAERAVDSEDVNTGLGHAVLGSVRLQEGQFEEAIALCRKSVSFRANCPFALGQLATVQNFCGDAQGAVKSAREALSLRNAHPPPLLNLLAMAYRDLGDAVQSLPVARCAVELAPDFVEAHATLCSGYVLANDMKRAEAEAKEIIAMDADFSTSAYTERLPYREPENRERLMELLRGAGLPS